MKADEFVRLMDIEKSAGDYDFLNRDVISGFDFSPIAVLKPRREEKDFDIVQMEWGFIPDALYWPFWETREQVTQGRLPHRYPDGRFMDGLNFLNAVGEEILKKGKVYRNAALQRPCLILCTGYYEWRHFYPINKRTGQPRKTAEKYPYRVTLANRDYFYIAAIWQEWMDADSGEVVETVAMITTAANEVASEIHNSKKRQPTLLTDGLAWEWMFGKRTEERILEIANFKIPWQEMRYYTLAKDFLNSHDPLKPHHYPDLPPLDVPGGDLNYEATTPVQPTLF